MGPAVGLAVGAEDAGAAVGDDVVGPVVGIEVAGAVVGAVGVAVGDRVGANV